MIQNRDPSDYLTLIAIARAAHIVGDRHLKRTAIEDLSKGHGINVVFVKNHPSLADPRGNAHQAPAKREGDL